VFLTSFEVLSGHLTGDLPNYVYTNKLNYFVSKCEWLNIFRLPM